MLRGIGHAMTRQSTIRQPTTGQPMHGGWGRLISAKAVCCGVLLLFLSGALTVNGVLGWFRDGSLAWLALAVAGAVAATFFWFRHRRRDSGVSENPPWPKVKGAP